jgi:hypothetical protein
MMRVRLRFERVYGTISRYGENPRESPPGSPIILDDYPLPGERATIYLGEPVEELYRTYQVASAGAFILVRRNVLHEDITEADEAAALQQAQTEPLGNDLARWNWYITIVIERTVDVFDTQCTPARWFSVDPVLVSRLERGFSTYGSYQADFLVDYLATHIPKHFFATRDVDDRVVLFAEDGPAFRMFQVTAGNVTGSTSGPIHLCNVGQIRTTLSKLQSEGQMALAPLAPATLITLVEKATQSDLKGRALEELVSKLFSTISGLKVETRTQTATEEIDISIFNDTTDGFLAKEGAVILAECKNWSGKCGRDEFSLLEKKAENRRERCSLSFLISWNGFTSTIEKELLRSSRQRLVIVPLTGNELRKAVADNNFFEVIQAAWRDAVFT